MCVDIASIINHALSSLTLFYQAYSTVVFCGYLLIGYIIIFL